MKLFIKKTTFMVACAITALVATSCNPENKERSADELTAINADAAKVTATFIERTVGPTYSNLAAKAEQLADILATFKTQPTTANLEAACDAFLEARSWWERSEAFLFGIAGDQGIDPHIDSWPLDATAFNRLMGSATDLELLGGEDGDLAAGELDRTLMGFHAIEYVLFRNGNPRPVDNIDSMSRVYVAAVAGDLRNRCFQLEVGWLGNKAPKAHRELFEEGGRLEELSVTVMQGDYSYGENMLNAGQAGSTYATKLAAIAAIIDGCKTIADEVGTSKIGKPAGVDASTADTTYIESPYSQKSIDDFVDNFISIKNVYNGGIEGNRDEATSLYTFVKTHISASLADRVNAAIDNAIVKIGDPTEGIPRPFVQNYTSERCLTAISACQAVDAIFSEVNDGLRNL